MEMRRQRNFIWIATLVSASFCFSHAQQDPMYSQYMWNSLSVNPAYAGSADALSALMLIRKQWLGIAGAPHTQNTAVHMPDRMGKNAFGLNITNDQISYLGQTWTTLSYSYRIITNRGNLCLGLSASVYNYRINWNKAKLIDPNDVIPAIYGRSMVLPNTGFGIYYYADNFYLGASVPHLLVNSLSTFTPGVKFDDKDVTVAALKRHYFVMGGYVFKPSPNLWFKPSFLYKYVYGAPMQFDFNLNLYFNQKFGIGTSFRSGDGIVALMEYHFTPQFTAGYGYDYPFTALNGYTSGSHELLLRYDFRFSNHAVVSPRVF